MSDNNVTIQRPAVDKNANCCSCRLLSDISSILLSYPEQVKLKIVITDGRAKQNRCVICYIKVYNDAGEVLFCPPVDISAMWWMSELRYHSHA